MNHLTGMLTAPCEVRVRQVRVMYTLKKIDNSGSVRLNDSSKVTQLEWNLEGNMYYFTSLAITGKGPLPLVIEDHSYKGTDLGKSPQSLHGSRSAVSCQKSEIQNNQEACAFSFTGWTIWLQVKFTGRMMTNRLSRSEYHSFPYILSSQGREGLGMTASMMSLQASHICQTEWPSSSSFAELSVTQENNINIKPCDSHKDIVRQERTVVLKIFSVPNHRSGNTSFE